VRPTATDACATLRGLPSSIIFSLPVPVWPGLRDEFYALHGWDAERGWPTLERLRELDMEDVYEPMVDGAVMAG